jgi:hypothetical protein
VGLGLFLWRFWFAGGLVSGIYGAEYWEAQGISEEAWDIRRMNEGHISRGGAFVSVPTTARRIATPIARHQLFLPGMVDLTGIS